MRNLNRLPTGGPFETYRNAATFNWKSMRAFYEDEELIRVKYRVWEELKCDPLFSRSTETLSTTKLKELTQKRVQKLALYYDFLNEDDVKDFPMKQVAINEAMSYWELGMNVKYGLHLNVSPFKQNSLHSTILFFLYLSCFKTYCADWVQQDMNQLLKNVKLLNILAVLL